MQQRDLPFEDEEEGFYEKDLPKHACVYVYIFIKKMYLFFPPDIVVFMIQLLL
jgi:hypothetical protein